MADNLVYNKTELKLLRTFGIHSFSNTYFNWKRKATVANELCQLIHNIGKKELRILEIGCGEGDVSFLLNSKLSKDAQVRFSCIDISLDDLEFAKLRAGYYGYTNFEFEAMEAYSLKYPDNTFDAVICCEVMEHFLDPLTVLKEMLRVLKPGGMSVVTTPNGGFKLTGMLGIIKRLLTLRWNELALSKKVQASVDLPVGANNAGFGHVSVFSKNKWAGLIQKAGFKMKKARGTGGIIYGNADRDSNRLFVSIAIAADTIFDRLPCSAFCSEILQLSFVKPIKAKNNGPSK